MSNKLGLHWIRLHPDTRDLAHIERMQYPSAKLFEWHWSDRNACRELLSVLPANAYITPRNHPLSEQKQDMWNDPTGTGRRHADDWADKVRGGNYHLPVERSFFLGVNEPDATSGDRNAIDLYTATYLDRLREHGLRGGAFNFSTGHPRTRDGTGGTPPDYTVFERSHQAIVRGQHIAVAHIYGSAAQPLVPGHFDRLKACSWQDVTWLIGECAIDEHVVGGGPHDGYLTALRGRINDYCAWLDKLILGVNDSRIHSFQVFTYDFSHPWSSFDVREVRDALERFEWQHGKVAAPTPQEPVIAPGPTPPKPQEPKIPYGARIVTTVTANLREWSSLQSRIIREVAPGTVFDMVGYNDDWYQVPRGDGEGDGWLHHSVVKQAGPEPAPSPATVPAGIIDPLTALAFLQVESANRAFEGGLLVIRFEVHRFKANLKNDELFNRHFKFTPGNYGEQYWRPDEGSAWRHAHGNQHERHELLQFASRLNQKAAYLSIGMGLGQVMGENHARIGYSNPFAMFKAFSHPRYGVNAQVLGFMAYIYSDPALLDALRRGDWHRAVQGYNGTGQESVYVLALKKARAEIMQEVGA